MPHATPDNASASVERAPATPDKTPEAPRTIFDQRETVERPVPWEESPAARFRDALDMFMPDLPQDVRDRVHAAALTGEHTDLRALKETLGDVASARRIASLAEKSADRKVIGGTLADTFVRMFADTGFNANGFNVARALRWHGARTGRADLRAVYPASGGDYSRLLANIDHTPVASVDCVTTSGPQGADVVARSKGKEARLVKKTIDVAIADGDLPAGSADVVLLDTTGVAVTFFDAFGSVDHLLAPDGIIIATGAGYMAVGGVHETLAQHLPTDRYRLVGRSGNAYIIERVPQASRGPNTDATTSPSP